MGRAARLTAGFFRLAFWPLLVAVLIVLLLQPVYYATLGLVGSMASRQSTAAHIRAAFDAGVLSDDGNPRSLFWRTSAHSISLAYIFAGASLFAAARQRDWPPRGLIVLSDVLGSGFNFIDFLINPPMMPMLIAFFVLLTDRRNAGLLALAAVFAWFGGYAETWLAKWVLAYLALPGSSAVVSDIFSNVANRTGGVVVPLLIVAAIAHYAATISRVAWRRALWLCSPVLVTVLWFEALSSHTQFHLTVSSRSAAAALAIMLSAMVVSMSRRPSLAELWDQLAILRAKLPLIGSIRVDP